MDFKTLGNNVSDSRTFKGPFAKPFLAPRGLFVAANKLFVSDTGQNKVFIWNEIPTNEYQDPDVVLGQENIEGFERNAGGNASASTLQYPSGVWSDGVKLIVSDAWNHRVLIWSKMPTSNAQPADIVIGQPDFTSNKPNVHGIGDDPTAQSLNWPYGVFSDGKSLWIADTGNRRVLFFETIPTRSYSKADNVIGKDSFKSKDYDSGEPIWPYSVKINKRGNLVIADTQFYRVLIWNNKNDAFYKPADIIIGQKNFEDCGQNQFRLSPEGNTLNWTYDACFYKEGILVNDTGNSRILYFRNIPSKNNEYANAIIGRPNFNTSSEYKENMLGTKSAIYWPFSILADKNILYIADTGNHRIVIATLKL